MFDNKRDSRISPFLDLVRDWLYVQARIQLLDEEDAAFFALLESEVRIADEILLHKPSTVFETHCQDYVLATNDLIEMSASRYRALHAQLNCLPIN